MAMEVRGRDELPFASVTRTLDADELMKCGYNFHLSQPVSYSSTRFVTTRRTHRDSTRYKESKKSIYDLGDLAWEPHDRAGVFG
jgi:hypothetical protein